ncbi:BTAD domain-containing putative transcriptional regulator [Nocardia sp. NPDC051030]|uniref:AfsR/SARP family transcriptional regulator n=1 Tax=Nocardia sp. NPDC051030 TaxID=3155162 RepID=UPI0034452211
MNEIRFAVLGPLTAHRGTAALDVGSPQRQAVLAALLLQHNHTASLAQLIDAVWGTEPPARAAGAIRNHIADLRTVLEPDRQSRTPPEILVSAGDGYTLRLPAGAVDSDTFADTFRLATEVAAAGDPARAHALLISLRPVWRGEPLSGVPGPYAEAHRARLLEQHFAVRRLRIELDLVLGRHAELIGELMSLTAEYPFDEGLRVQLMTALSRSGRQAEALEVYADIRRTLIEELGVEPGPDLAALQQQILAGDLAAPAKSEIEARSHGGESVSAATDSILRQPVAVHPRELPPAPADFIGRELLQDRIRAALRPGADALAVTVLSGIGGVGKTSLALRVAHRIRDDYPDGQLYVDLRGDGEEPADSADVLADFLRALGLPAAEIPATRTARIGAYRTLTADRRILVLLDNAFDTAQVTPLLPGTSGNAALITTRHRLLAPPGAARFQVPLPDESEAVAMLARFIGGEQVAVAPGQARELVRACGQLPLALRILGARAAARPERGLGMLLTRLRDEGRRLDELRVGDVSVEATIRVGYQARTPAQARALRICALLEAPDFPIAVAAVLLDRSETETEDLLEDLVAAGLLEPHADDRYRFHDLVRLFAVGRAREEESAADRDAALMRLVDFLYATLLRAMSATAPVTSVVTNLFSTEHTGMRFADADAARAWLLSEHTLLVAAFSHVLRDIPSGSHIVVDALSVIAMSGLFPGPAHQREVERLADRAVAASERNDGPEPWRARAWHARAWLAYIRGDLAAAETDLREAIRRERATGDPLSLYMSTRLLAAVLADQGRDAEGVEYFVESETVGGDVDDPTSPASFHKEVAQLFTTLSSDRADVNVAAAQRVYGAYDRLQATR